MTGPEPQRTPSIDEIPLAGGHVNTVFRVGDTVRRTPGPHTPAVHELLRHLEDVGFNGAPRVIGYDERGREVLSYIEGDVPVDLPAPPYAWSDTALTDIGRLLRSYHTAVGSFRPSHTGWNNEFAPSDGGPIICHNDVDQWNVVFREGRAVALIDWDFAAPGFAQWDLAIAALMLVPITDEPNRQEIGSEGPYRPVERLGLLCEAYGLDDPAALVPVIGDVVRVRYERRRAKVEAGRSVYVGIDNESVLEQMRRDIAHFDTVRRDLAG